MKKKNIYILLLVLGLGALSIYLMKRDDRSSIRTELMDFAVKDSASITKVFLANRNGNQVTLDKKENGVWVLNDSLKPRPDVLKNLLAAIYSISVKSRVPKSGFNNVITDLAVGGIKCEVYLRNEKKPFRVYYVGNQTADALGTFMMIENSNVPFVMEIPGFNGYLTPWYNPTPQVWIDPIIFKYTSSEIKSIALNYPSHPGWSFALQRTGEKFQLNIPAELKVYSSIDSVAVDNYLDLFQNVYYEVVEVKMSKEKRDSILQTTPLNQMEIETVSNEKRQILIFPMAINDGSITVQDSLGNPLKYDLDRMYGFLPHKNQWLVIQHHSFDKLFRRGEDFMLKKQANKLRLK